MPALARSLHSACAASACAPHRRLPHWPHSQPTAARASASSRTECASVVAARSSSRTSVAGSAASTRAHSRAAAYSSAAPIAFRTRSTVANAASLSRAPAGASAAPATARSAAAGRPRARWTSAARGAARSPPRRRSAAARPRRPSRAAAGGVPGLPKEHRGCRCRAAQGEPARGAEDELAPVQRRGRARPCRRQLQTAEGGRGRRGEGHRWMAIQLRVEIASLVRLHSRSSQLEFQAVRVVCHARTPLLYQAAIRP